MRSVGWLALLVTTLGLLLGNTPCAQQTVVPGSPAGTFHVMETLGTNACAGGFDPDPTLDYTTEIRANGGVAYWHRGDDPFATGTYDQATGHFHFVATQDVAAYGDDAGVRCALRETETIDGTLALGVADAGIDVGTSSDASVSSDAASSYDGGPDAGLSSTGFTGTDTIQLSIAPGSDCTLLFAQNGGPFSTLPCAASYTMSATRN